MHAEIKHCPPGFFTDTKNTFGGSEYVKDGLIAIVEVTGKDEWFERMKAVQDEIWANPAIETKYGKIPSTNIEINGEQIQALTRMYTMTGEKTYLEWFTVEPDESHQYTIENADTGETEVYAGKSLRDGLPVRLDASKSLRIIVKPKS